MDLINGGHEPEKVELRTIPYGKCFMCEGNIYMHADLYCANQKLPKEKTGAVNLKSGSTRLFCTNKEVVQLKATTHIERVPPGECNG